jgi:hypothetical protein
VDTLSIVSYVLPAVEAWRTPSAGAVKRYHTLFEFCDGCKLHDWNGSNAACVAPVTSSVSVNGTVVTSVAALQSSFAGGGLWLITTSMAATVAPAATSIGTATVGSSGGLDAPSSAPFQNSGGPGSGAGGESGPTCEPPAKFGSTASISTVYAPGGRPASS